jgi:hypothetical protein
MAKQLVYIQNRVNNAAIRRIKNERDDLVYVVPSYTLPDNCVMNGGLYPADEIAKSYMTLEDTPAPAGHPYDAQGNYISASSPDGVLYFQCGIFNKNVQRVQDDTYGHRVYVEKHIHVETAMKTERGKRIIEAIDAGQPIHTSTGILMDQIEQPGTMNGKQYGWVASGMLFDHDAILLDEEGAATPADGVGMMVNTHHFKTIRKSGALMHVNSVKINESMRDMESLIADAVRVQFGDDDKHVWLADWGQDYAVFESMDSGVMRVGLSVTDKSVTFTGEPVPVKRVTKWEPTQATTEENKTTINNQEGKSMISKDHVQKVLTANKIDFSKMDEAQMIAAYEQTFKGNAAEVTNQPGEQSKPGEVVVNAEVKQMLRELIGEALQTNQQTAEAGQRTDLAAKLKANGVELSEAEQKAMSVNSLQNLVAKTSPAKGAFTLAGGQLTNNAKTSLSDAQMPE